MLSQYSDLFAGWTTRVSFPVEQNILLPTTSRPDHPRASGYRNRFVEESFQCMKLIAHFHLMPIVRGECLVKQRGQLI
jgi:hypothetical protein